MKRLYSFSLSIPLIYNTFGIRGDDGELVLGLADSLEWEEPCRVDFPCPKDESRRYQSEEKIHFHVFSKFKDYFSDDGTRSYQMPEKYFHCEITGIIADSEGRAYTLVEDSVIKICKALSILISCHNCNKQGYQPRVEPDDKHMKWHKEKYEPYEALIEQAIQPREYIDENGNRVICLYAESGIEFSGSISHTIFGKMNTEHFPDYYYYEKFPVLNHIMDEFYIALGRETITSKFFHLFAIIEYIEREFVNLADAQMFFDDSEKKQVLDCLEHLNMSKEKRERLKSSVKGVMSRATQLGREEKLVNILHNMGIREFSNCGTPFVVNKGSVKELVALRNSFFHGEGKATENSTARISVETAVARLMYLCEKIIVYVAEEEKSKNRQT